MVGSALRLPDYKYRPAAGWVRCPCPPSVDLPFRSSPAPSPTSRREGSRLHGRNFVTSPLPRVQIGTEAGRFQELVVEAATSGLILARLTGQPPGTYRVVVQFGRTGLVIGTLDVTIGTVGPRGEKGDKGDPGQSVDLAATDARYPRLSGDNVYLGNQSVAGSMSATRFIGDGSGLTNITANLSADPTIAALVARIESLERQVGTPPPPPPPPPTGAGQWSQAFVGDARVEGVAQTPTATSWSQEPLQAKWTSAAVCSVLRISTIFLWPSLRPTAHMCGRSNSGIRGLTRASESRRIEAETSWLPGLFSGQVSFRIVCP